MVQETLYTARFHRPDWLARATACTIEMPIERNGALVAPSEGTVSVYDASGTAIVDGEDVTITNQIATYAISAATLPATLELSNTWREEWSLTMPDRSTAYVFHRDAALVLKHVYPTLTIDNLKRLHTEIVDWYSDDLTKVQNIMDAAWEHIEVMLMGQGKLPYRVLSAWSLRRLHECLTLTGLFTDAMTLTSTDGKYKELADRYAKCAADEWSQLVLKYDYANDNSMTDDMDAVEASVWLCASGRG